MDLDYEPSTARRRRRLTEADVSAFALKLAIAYLVVSILTIPFVGDVWSGEVTLLALIQLPKTVPAHWLRSDVVTPAIRALGLSPGSPSRDHALASPFALAITYLVPLTAMATVVWRRTGMPRRFRRLTLLLAALAVVDFAMVMGFSRGPGLSIY
jgi:hypothetical protein